MTPTVPPVRRLVSGIILGAVALLTAAGCGGTSGPTASPLPADHDTLRLAMYADPSTMDPDVYYDVEATPIVHGLYDGLLAYAPDSTRLVGDLATSWTVSADRRTYTFRLRHGVTFHDGAAFTSADVAQSFARRTAVKQPSGYMLDAVIRVATPSPDVAVVQLSHPVAPFLDYLASTWGPKMIGPAALIEHAASDHSRSWLDRHDDGTGPYTLTRAAKGREYVLTRAARYWGQAANFDHVQIRVIGDAQAQAQELQTGDLDAVLHGYSATNMPSLAHDPRFTVLHDSAFLRVTAYVNTHRTALRDPAVRRTLANVLDPAAVKAAMANDPEETSTGGTSAAAAFPVPGASLPDGNYPPGILLNDHHQTPSLGVATVRLADHLTSPIEVAYTADESGSLRLFAEAVATRLRAQGLDVDVRETSLAAAYGYATDPADAPDLLLNTNTPDAAHPDTWARIVWYSTGGLNFLGYSDPGLDALLDRAQRAAPANVDALYREAGQRVADSDAFLNLADLQDIIVLRSDLTGAEHVPAYPWSLDLARLRRD